MVVMRLYGNRFTYLWLGDFQKWVALQYLTSLQQLCVNNWGTTIPEWIGNLISSLKSLVFREYCPELTSLPQGIRSLPSLQSLRIYDCPMFFFFFLKRCRTEIGEDWPLISHIQHLELNQLVQEDNDQVQN